MTRANLVNAFSLATIAAIFALATIPVKPVNAIDANDFNPARIIDDSIFFNSNSMSVSQIQNFLDDKMPECDTNGDEMFAGVLRRNYSSDNPPPYTCLKDYYENPNNQQNNYGGGSIPSGAHSAARLIHDSAERHGINPQVLIVFLQKEQGLITDDWPWERQYEIAMGYGCPDTAPCDDEYYGFANQVDKAAYQLNRYTEYPQYYNHAVGNNYVRFHPNSSCGGTTVDIRTAATAALYNYTPYQPNQAALNAGYGTGNSCSAYGNRNFFLFFNDWFGSTYSELGFESLDNPRWLELTEDTPKYDLRSGLPSGGSFEAGRKLYYDTKLSLNGQWYLRTESDTTNGKERGFPYSMLDEITINYEPLSQPRWLEADSLAPYRNPATRQAGALSLLKGSISYFDSKFTIGSETYLRTANDTTDGQIDGVRYNNFKEVALNYGQLETPRRFQVTQTVNKINVRTNEVLETLDVGQEIHFDQAVNFNGESYLRPTADTATSVESGVQADSVDEAPLNFEALDRPRWMKVTTVSRAIDPRTGETYGPLSRKGDILYLDTKFEFNNQTYLRPESLTSTDIDAGIPYSRFDNIPLDYQPLDRPRWILTPNQPLELINPVTRDPSGSALDPNEWYFFDTKVLVGDMLFLRDTNNTANGTAVGVRFADLIDDQVRYTVMDQPRNLRIIDDTRKRALPGGQMIDNTLRAGREIMFTTKAEVNGTLYLRTQTDTDRNNDKGIPYSELKN